MDGQMGVLIEDVRVHMDKADRGLMISDAPVDTFLWREMPSALDRCGPHTHYKPRNLQEMSARNLTLEKVKKEARYIALPTWRGYLGDLEKCLSYDAAQKANNMASVAQFANVLHALKRIRRVAGDHRPPLLSLFRACDPECRSMVSRPMFIEVLASLEIALTEAEKNEIATFFSGTDMNVHYLIFLHDVLPHMELPQASAQRQQSIANAAAAGGGGGSGAPTLLTLGSPDIVGVSGGYAGYAGGQSTMDATPADGGRQANIDKGKIDYLTQENQKLAAKMDDLSKLNFKLSETASNPAAAVQKLHTDVALLEETLLQKAKRAEEDAKKTEITLNSQITIQEHELQTLKAMVQAKDGLLQDQRRELDSILSQMRFLKS